MPSAIPEEPPVAVVLHYTGHDDDRTGIASVIRSLAAEGRFECLMGVNPGFGQMRSPPLATLVFPRLEGEAIGLRSAWGALAVARAARRWLGEDPRRIFHGHSRAGLLAALWLTGFGERRVVASVHCYGHHPWFYRWAAGRLGPRLVWLTPAMKAHYKIPGGGWKGCIPNGWTPRSVLSGPASVLATSTSPASPLPLRRSAPPNPLIVGGAGLLVRWKGWHLVLEALSLLPESLRSRVEFRHVGATPSDPAQAAYAGELRALAARRGVEGRVRWLGWQSSTEAWLGEIDCLLVASDREPFSMAALEALWAGVPVVAADCGGPTDFVVQGRNGWLFRSGDPADLARALGRLVRTDALARVRIEATDLARFSGSAVARQWEAAYLRLISADASERIVV